MNKNQAISNLKELDEIFRTLGVEYWLSNGTLLGLYRDNELIDNDANTDLSVNVKTISKDMFQKIKSAGFSLVSFFGKLQDGFTVEIAKNDIKTNLFFFYKNKEKWYHSVYVDIDGEESLKHDYIYTPFELTEQSFNGNQFVIPKQTEEVLAQQYGDDWKIPNPNWSATESPKNAINTNEKFKFSESENDFNDLMNFENKSYWDEFYKSNKDLNKESAFARFVYEDLEKRDLNLDAINMVDLGCGNLRDTKYFHSKGINIEGVDLSSNQNDSSIKTYNKSVLDVDLKPYNVFYARFFIHSIKEEIFDELLEKIKGESENYIFYIETRSTKNITNDKKSITFFKSAIGDKHYRYLYSKEYFESKLAPQFNIDYMIEDNGVAIYKEEDPYCLRVILKSK
ncbi:class I SAM-dependent methyltransferase [Brumimicrobium aurantiacum]|uniref:Methyltransferase domain-containing protein n=1 Tax=Brumimicrobium aurantiacum TaxID=1737063 RepID=A0A3E1EZP6_9FLAO|nr:hypothetical protein [Brumimicrobium aurantiacum]RFC55025.1 hypothetical protein DXU93_04170 [Brumimicrobium aurantiacum]